MRKALQTLKDNRRGKDPRVDLIEVALRGGKPGFEKIIKLCINMDMSNVDRQMLASFSAEAKKESVQRKLEITTAPSGAVVISGFRWTDSFFASAEKDASI